jgi:hypothetical protein
MLICLFRCCHAHTHHHLSTNALSNIFRKKSFIPWTAARNAMLATLRDATEFMVAVNYLPRGYLWASTLTYIQVGMLGTCSAFLRLFGLFKFHHEH